MISKKISKLEIDKLNSLILEIGKIGKCPKCYFENRKHKIKVLSKTFNIAYGFKCDTCSGIYSIDKIIQTVDMDIKRTEDDTKRNSTAK